MIKRTIRMVMIVAAFSFFLNGCALIFQSGRRSDLERIAELEKELEALRNTQSSLEDRLAREINDKQVSVKMQDKGLVITFLAEVLFDSGKAKLKPESLPILDKVAGIINEEAPENNIGIEGHTDNVPIKHSSWKSNWELSSHRALSVLYYLESKGVQSEKLSASGYGEYKPVSSNDSSEGRQMNRRVEIVIMPKTSKKAGKEVSQMKGTKADEEELK